MADLKEMAERLRGVGGSSLCPGSEMRNILGDVTRECPRDEDGDAMTCESCRCLMRGRLAYALEDALNQSKSTGLPEGVEWPRFEDGELVRFGDEFEYCGVKPRVTDVEFRDGKTTVWGGVDTDYPTVHVENEPLKRPADKPDSQEAIDADAAKDPCEYFNGRTPGKCADCKLHADDAGFDFDGRFAECRTAMARDLLARQRKLMGGE